MAKLLTLQAVIELEGINPYVPISAEQAAALRPDWHKPLPVLVQVNGQPADPWKTNLVPKGGGRFCLYLHGDVRHASRTQVGDRVTVRLCVNEAYRNGPQHPVPPALQQALQTDQTVRMYWEALPPSRQKEVLRYFAGLKSEAAKTRNLTALLQVLSGQSGHYMGRDWINGK